MPSSTRVSPRLDAPGERLLQRLAGFASLPFAGAIAPLVLLPLVSRAAGPAGWAGIATAQALGTLAAAVIMFGWSLSGQAEAALAEDEHDAADLYRLSVRSRLMLAAVVVPVGGLAVLLGSGAHAGTNALMFVAAASTGMSFAWFCIGRGRAGSIAAYEVLPKVLAMVLAAVVLVTTGLVWVYPAALLAATVVGVLLFQHRCLARAHAGPPIDFHTVRQDMAVRWRAAAVSITGGAYASAPMPIAAMLAPVEHVAMFASADRLYRYGLFGVIGLGNGLQAWVLGAGRAGLRRRRSVAITAHAVLGGTGLLFLLLLGDRVTSLVFGEAVAAAVALTAAYGVAYAAVSVSTPLVRNTLIPEGRSGLVLASTTVAGLLGLAAMWVLGKELGVAGVAWGLAASEVVNLLFLASVVLATAGHRGRGPVEREDAP